MRPTITFTAQSDGDDFDFTCPVGTNFLILLYARGRSTTGLTGADYNGDNLTREIEVNESDAGEANVEVWYLAEPDTGASYTLNTNINDGVSSYDQLIAIGFSYVDLDAPFFDKVEDFGDGDADLGDVSNVVDISADCCVIDIIADYRTDVQTAEGSDQVEVYTGTTYGCSKHSGINAGGSVTMAWDLKSTSVNRYAWAGVAIKGKTVGGIPIFY